MLVSVSNWKELKYQAAPAASRAAGMLSFSGLFSFLEKSQAPLTKTAKQGLLDGLGITPMRNDDGVWNVKIGFDGYNDMPTQNTHGDNQISLLRAA